MRTDRKSIKPWDITTKRSNRASDEFMLPLWEKFTPNEFYYCILPSDYQDNTYIVYITPKVYFEMHNAVYDDSMPIVDMLPPYLEEIFEGAYQVHRASYKQAKKDMDQAGFIWDHFFQTFIEKNVG